MASITTLIAAILAAVSALTSAVETAVLLLPLGRVYRLVESRVEGAEAVDDLVEHRHRLRAASTLVGGFAFAVAAVSGASLIGQPLAAAFSLTGTWAIALVDVLGGLVGVLLCYALAQALPRALAAANPERVALELGGVVEAFVSAVYPLARLMGAPSRWAVELVAKEATLTPWAVSPEFRGSSSGEEAEREETEERLLEAVSDFAEKVAREVMVPRTDVEALPDTITSAEAIAAIEATGFSRLPVYHESVDDVRGVLYAKDLLVALGHGDAAPDIARIARKPFFVPETKPVEELLLEMRTRTHIAIVADEYGGTAGIVSLEDLLEEIVGEISDEYDTEEPLLVELADRRWQVDARLPVNDLNEVFGTDLDTEADSVGGLFTEVAGRIPELGESLVIEGLLFTVTDREGTRILRLTVEPAEVRQEGDDDA